MKKETKMLFRTVIGSGSLFSSKHLSLRAVRDSVAESDIRVVVSKKVVSKAVSRNRLKRQIKWLVRETKPQSICAVFYTKKGADKVTLEELRREVIYLIKNV